MSWGPNATIERYAVDGSTTVWDTTIPFVSAAWLKCYQSDGVTFWTDVTSLAVIVPGVDPATGGTVTIAPALAVADGAVLIFRLEMPLAQTAITLGSNDELPSESAIAAWDQGVMQEAMIAEAVTRAANFPAFLNLAGPTLPKPVIGALLAWGGDGNIANALTSVPLVAVHGDVTLRASQTTTLVNTGAALACVPTSHISIMPMPGGIAGDIASGEFEIVPGTASFTINHPSNASTTRAGRYCLTI